MICRSMPRSGGRDSGVSISSSSCSGIPGHSTNAASWRSRRDRIASLRRSRPPRVAISSRRQKLPPGSMRRRCRRLAGRAAEIARSSPRHRCPSQLGLPSRTAVWPHELRSRRFVAESVDGVDTARELKKQESEIAQARVPRWTQASAWRPDAPEIAARSLAPKQWNLLGVHIGPSEAPRVDLPAPFPDAIGRLQPRRCRVVGTGGTVGRERDGR